jgi:hypothetical protein
MSPGDFEVALSAVSKVLVRAQLQSETMFPALGQLLLVAQGNPDLWNKKFESFEAFRLSLAERFGVGRQTSYDAMNYARRWSAVLPPADFASVGRVKLHLISKAVRKGKEAQATARKVIEFAKDHTATELEEYLSDKGLTEKGESSGAIFRIPANKRQTKDFTRWFKDPRVAAKVGSDKWADILEAMIQECSVEWYAAGEQAIDEAKEQEKNQAAESAA